MRETLEVESQKVWVIPAAGRKSMMSPPPNKRIEADLSNRDPRLVVGSCATLNVRFPIA